MADKTVLLVTNLDTRGPEFAQVADAGGLTIEAVREAYRVARKTSADCMKLVAVSERGSRKDSIDLYFLDRAGIDLRRAMDALPRKMPGVDHNLMHLMRSLAYFADAEAEPEPRMLVPFEWCEARDYALSRSRALLQEIIAPDR